MTALYDAIGRGIGEASRRGVNRKVIVAILTDGYENSSKEVTRQQVTDMISKYEASGWVFIFLAAGFSQFEAEKLSGSIGIKSSNTMGFSGNDVHASYSCASSAVRSYRGTGTISSNWKS